MESPYKNNSSSYSYPPHPTSPERHPYSNHHQYNNHSPPQPPLHHQQQHHAHQQQQHHISGPPPPPPPSSHIPPPPPLNHHSHHPHSYPPPPPPQQQNQQQHGHPPPVPPPILRSPPREPPSQSPYGNGARSGYYDPVGSSRREDANNWDYPDYNHKSTPKNPPMTRDPYVYPERTVDRAPSPPLRSPMERQHPHHSSYELRSPTTHSYPAVYPEIRNPIEQPQISTDYPVQVQRSAPEPMSPTVAQQPQSQSASSTPRKNANSAMSISALLSDGPPPLSTPAAPTVAPPAAMAPEPVHPPSFTSAPVAVVSGGPSLLPNRNGYGPEASLLNPPPRVPPPPARDPTPPPPPPPPQVMPPAAPLSPRPQSRPSPPPIVAPLAPAPERDALMAVSPIKPARLESPGPLGTPIAAQNSVVPPDSTQKTKRKYTKRQTNDGSASVTRGGRHSAGSAQALLHSPTETRRRVSHHMDVDMDEVDAHGIPLKDISELVKKIENETVTDSDPEDEKSAPLKDSYMGRMKKRHLETSKQEKEKRKRRRVCLQNKYENHFTRHSNIFNDVASDTFREKAQKIIAKKEEEEEKERKKEMQRKRRREKAAIEQRAKAEAAAKLKEEQRAERERLDAERAKESAGGIYLTLKTDGMEIDSEAPGDEEKAKNRKRPGPKPKKKPEEPKESKDGKPTKDAGKKSKDKPTKEVKEIEKVKEEEPIPKEISMLPSKVYNQVYDQIWKDMARKDIPKVFKVQQSSLATKQSNLRKTALLASKEARRWQVRTNKNIKDNISRAKRCMREMTTFWKRNEREERDARRRAEKEAQERAKKEEEMREARRQARKLNFLISQTELYSHFIGRKIKTDEVERSTDNGATGVMVKSSESADAQNKDEQLGDSVTKMEDLDFDESDDEALQKAAKTNAHMAVEEAKRKAQDFNKPKTDLSNVNLDEDEMNFQNPTSLGDIYIDQPKMLTCKLKEYQLKGLNWLVNLYEQGINGILADEMGLGKTVQSISVMAYLAEYHNIWGPFLVIAPASTLHNWQQEISRFVPELKVLPYWGNTKDRKILRKFWDRKQLTYTREAPFHVLVTSYQLVVADAQYFQRVKWQYMILDEAQAIKSSQSTRWKSLLAFHCRNRLLLTGTPIQNSMQELWALLHFIMPSLFDSHDEFSEWFSKDIESHAQSNTQLNEAQLRRLHMILKPFMLRRIKKHVQSELGDKVEIDVYCNLTYRQRLLYKGLRNKINLMDLVEKSIMGGEEGSQSLMNLVMQFRKVCNHPDLFERAETTSPLAFMKFPEAASFLREGAQIEVPYSNRNLIEYEVPSLVFRGEGRLSFPGNNSRAGFNQRYLDNLFNIWTPDYIAEASRQDRSGFSWLRFVDSSPAEASKAFKLPLIERAVSPLGKRGIGVFPDVYDDEQKFVPAHALLLVTEQRNGQMRSESIGTGHLSNLMNVARTIFEDERLHRIEPMASDVVCAAPIRIQSSDQGSLIEQDNILFDERTRRILYGPSGLEELSLLNNKIPPSHYPVPKLISPPISEVAGYSSIQVPSMRRFVADSGKLTRLDALLKELKAGGHRVLLYFQMTRMIDLMEEYLSFRQYKYLRLDGSSKLEDRRDMVMDWQTKPDIFIFLLSTRAGGLGINLTAADTVIFYDSDWNPTIDSQAMDRAHRLGQTRQVTVYRLITRGTIEERILLRAKQKAEVQKVVVGSGEAGEFRQVDFNKGSREMAMWLMDDGDEATMEKEFERRQRQKEVDESSKKPGPKKGSKRRKLGAAALDGVNSLEDMYHEGEGHFDDGSARPSEAATPASTNGAPTRKKAGHHHHHKGGKAAAANTAKSHRRKSAKERMAMVDGGNEHNDFDEGGDVSMAM